MGPQDVTQGSADRIIRWLGVSALAHAALCAGVLALVLRASEKQDAVLKVALITVGPPPPSAVVPPAQSKSGLVASTGWPPPPAPFPGPRGREGGGRQGGDARPVGAAQGAAILATDTPPGGRGGPAPIGPLQPAPSGPGREPPSSPSAFVVASSPPPLDLPDDPVPQDVGAGGASGPRLYPAASTGSGVFSAAGRGSSTGDGRALGAFPGPGSGVSGLGPGADGAGTGPGGGSSSAPPSAADLLGEIRRRIEAAKRYPVEALRQGIEGRVVVRFRVGADGEVEVAQVRRSSGSQLLDQASLDTVRRAVPFPPVRGWVQVPIAYSLSEWNR